MLIYSFVNGKMEGKGVQVMSDGSRYEGDYWDGKPHGSGKRAFRSGAVYEGEFRCATCPWPCPINGCKFVRAMRALPAFVHQGHAAVESGARVAFTGRGVGG